MLITDSVVEKLKTRIEAYCHKTGKSLSRFGRDCLGDPNSYWRIKTMTITRLRKIEVYLNNG